MLQQSKLFMPLSDADYYTIISNCTSSGLWCSYSMYELLKHLPPNDYSYLELLLLKTQHQEGSVNNCFTYIVTTLLALEILRVCYPGRRDEWNLIVQKSLKSLDYMR